jgi:hypothetical protein
MVFIMNRESESYREDLQMRVGVMRQKGKVEESTYLTWTGSSDQNKLETPQEKDKGNKRGVHECDGRARDPMFIINPDAMVLRTIF